MKYPELKGLCKNCLGCNRLEITNYAGTYQCSNYIDGTKKENLGVQVSLKNWRAKDEQGNK